MGTYEDYKSREETKEDKPIKKTKRDLKLDKFTQEKDAYVKRRSMELKKSNPEMPLWKAQGSAEQEFFQIIRGEQEAKRATLGQLSTPRIKTVTRSPAQLIGQAIKPTQKETKESIQRYAKVLKGDRSELRLPARLLAEQLTKENREKRWEQLKEMKTTAGNLIPGVVDQREQRRLRKERQQEVESYFNPKGKTLREKEEEDEMGFDQLGKTIGEDIPREVENTVKEAVNNTVKPHERKKALRIMGGLAGIWSSGGNKNKLQQATDQVQGIKKKRKKSNIMDLMKGRIGNN